MALVSALIATVVLTGLGVALALAGLEETMLAAHDRASRSLRLAADSAARIAVSDLTRAASWTPLAAINSRFTDTTLRPPGPWDGVEIDLVAQTAIVQAESDNGAGPGEAPRTWRLFSAGPLARAAPGSECAPLYLVVWVADDGADTDGDPESDSNGILTLRADALGPDGGRATTIVSLSRTAVSGGPDEVRILTIRPGG